VSLVATIHFEDGTTDTVTDVEENIFEWLHEELNESRLQTGLYFQRVGGGTVMKKAGVRRIDVMPDEESAHDDR
jgi:hypothetical protein